MKRNTVVLVVILFLSASVFSGYLFNNDGTLTEKGQIVPEFKLTTLSGTEISTDNLRGKVVLINFFAIWCSPCIGEMPVMEKEIWQKYKNRDDFYLISIGREHEAAELIRFKNECAKQS